MKTLFIIWANIVFSVPVLAEAAKAGMERNTNEIAGRATSPIELAIILFLLFVLFKLFGIKGKPQKAVVTKINTKLPTFADIVTDAVGEMKPVSRNTKVGSKLLESKNDVETYMFVAKVDNSQVRREEKAETLKVQKSLNKVIKIIAIIALVSIFLNLVLIML